MKGKENLNRILQALLAGSVVEEKDSGNWHIRKYVDGTAEMWYRGDLGQVTLSTRLGADIVSAPIRITFPLTFKEIPRCIVGYEGSLTGYATVQNSGTGKTTTTQTYVVRLCRIGTESVSLQNNVFTVYAWGKWK